MPDPVPDMAYDEEAGRKWMRVALHDLCQPLTALECCLYVGTMDIDGERPAEDDLHETIRAALVECQRMMSRVRAMQERLHEDDGGQTEQQ